MPIKNMETAQRSTFIFLLLGAILVVFCLLTQIADNIGAVFGYDLVKGDLDMNKLGWLWVAIVVAYCFGAEGLKVLRAKSVEGTRYENGEFKEEELSNMVKAIAITFAMALLSLVVMVRGGNIDPLIYVLAAGIDVIACMIGTAMANGAQLKKLEEAVLAGGLDAEDDLNQDGKLDYLDLMLAAKQNGLKMSEAQAKDMAKRVFGPSGELMLTILEPKDINPPRRK